MFSSRTVTSHLGSTMKTIIALTMINTQRRSGRWRISTEDIFNRLKFDRWTCREICSDFVSNFKTTTFHRDVRQYQVFYYDVNVVHFIFKAVRWDVLLRQKWLESCCGWAKFDIIGNVCVHYTTILPVVLILVSVNAHVHLLAHALHCWNRSLQTTSALHDRMSVTGYVITSPLAIDLATCPHNLDTNLVSALRWCL